ncbi:MAG: polyprenol monophosphomannose synthase [Chthoniobacterales bacterium]
MKTLVIIPTYNERESIRELISAIHSHLPACDILIVDDASPDGTGRLVAEIGAADPRLNLLERRGKLGLGTAYIAGFRHALESGYECIIGMDADFSHDPAHLPQLVGALSHCDLAIGSRYVPGGSTPDWKMSRRLVSRFGNWFARTFLELPVRDCTTGYKCYRREALARLDLDRIHLIGYAFLIETTYQCFQNGARIEELPITFIDRRVGKSKMSGAIALEAFRYVVRRRWSRGRTTRS